MEILQTIWTALTTENEMLTLIICSPLTFLEVYISSLIFTTILNIKSNNKTFIMYVTLFSIIALLDIFIIPAPFNTFINLIACPILVYFIFKTDILKAIFAEIIPYIIFVVVGSLLINICVIFTKIPTGIFVTIPMAKLSCSLLMYLVAYIIYRLLKHFSINITLLERLKKNNKLILIINLIIGIVAIAMQSYLISIYNSFIPISTTIINISILLVYFLFSMYSIIRTNKLEITAQRLEEEKLYNKTLTILYDNIRGFKHDFNNIVQAIGGYISTNNIDGLKDYYSDLMADCQKVNNLAILNPELINNPAVYSLLTSKYHKATELEINMNFEVFLDLETLNIKTYDLTRMLGILLDNAIEASSKCTEKIINITIRKDNKVNRQLFIIENTYSNKNVNTDRIFEKGYTSKAEDGKNHGLGLWEVRKILKKNNNLNLFTTKTDKFFKQQLEIYI